MSQETNIDTVLDAAALKIRLFYTEFGSLVDLAIG
jgi:hypothetical protein